MMKPYTKRWFYELLLASSPQFVKKHRLSRNFMKKTAQRAEEAFILGKNDAEARKPKEDFSKYLPNAEDMPLLSFVQEAYNTGYMIQEENGGE